MAYFCFVKLKSRHACHRIFLLSNLKLIIMKKRTFVLIAPFPVPRSPFSPFSRICNSGAVSISIFNAKKTILPCFSEKMLIFAAEKDLVAMRTTAIERGLQIPILGTSELQIRWNGDFEIPSGTQATFMVHECPPANNVVHTEH